MNLRILGFVIIFGSKMQPKLNVVCRRQRIASTATNISRL